jgi:hypothetical protein
MAAELQCLLFILVETLTKKQWDWQVDKDHQTGVLVHDR